MVIRVPPLASVLLLQLEVYAETRTESAMRLEVRMEDVAGASFLAPVELIPNDLELMTFVCRPPGPVVSFSFAFNDATGGPVPSGGGTVSIDSIAVTEVGGSSCEPCIVQ